MLRYYDYLLPDNLREIVQRVRDSPSGQERKVKTATRNGAEIRVYPWRELQFGDYFKFPLGSTRFEAFRTAVSQKSAEMDCELTLHRINLGTHEDPVPGVMVIRSIEGVRGLRIKADAKMNRKTNISDVQSVRVRKNARRKENRKKLNEESRNNVKEVAAPRHPEPLEEGVKVKKVKKVKIAKGAAKEVVDVESPNYDRRAAIAASLARANKEGF